MADFADVAVIAEKNLPVDDDAGAGTAVQSHQNRVFAVAGSTEVVLRQRQLRMSWPTKLVTLKRCCRLSTSAQLLTLMCGM